MRFDLQIFSGGVCTALVIAACQFVSWQKPGKKEIRFLCLSTQAKTKNKKNKINWMSFQAQIHVVQKAGALRVQRTVQGTVTQLVLFFPTLQKIAKI